MIRLLRGDFDSIRNGRYIGDPIIADNKQVILGEGQYKIGDYVLTIPVEKCDVCYSDYDLTEIGFFKYGAKWFNRGAGTENK